MGVWYVCMLNVCVYVCVVSVYTCVCAFGVGRAGFPTPGQSNSPFSPLQTGFTNEFASVLLFTNIQKLRTTRLAWEQPAGTLCTSWSQRGTSEAVEMRCPIHEMLAQSVVSSPC